MSFRDSHLSTSPGTLSTVKCPSAVRAILRPTTEQYHAFTRHICAAHSWYTHLALFGGGEFVVFVAPDAGTSGLVRSSPASGRKVICEGAEFTDECPRLNDVWRTTEEYRRRFGYLDFMWRSSPESDFFRDAGPAIRLPGRIEKRCRFAIHPYVSWEFADVITSGIHAEAITQLRSGASHPARSLLLELLDFVVDGEKTWCTLNDADRKLGLAQCESDVAPRPSAVSTDLSRYFDIEESIAAISGMLHAQEVAKIQQALAALDDWLVSGVY